MKDIFVFLRVIINILIIINAQLAAGDVIHIVTSTATSCPGEFKGEPCLTLQQYASNPSQSSNVTLILESGTHRLLRYRSLGTKLDRLMMISEGAQIILSNDLIFSWSCLTVRLSGIAFTCITGEYPIVIIRYTQELLIENCKFQGVRLDLYDVTTTVILRSCFYDYFGQPVGVIYFGSSSSDSTLNISECIFSNNTWRYSYAYGGGAIYLSGRGSIVIDSTTFINNTSHHHGGALYLSGTRGSVLINASTFVNNSALEGNGGALYLTGEGSNNIIIRKTIFAFNSANNGHGGAISIAKSNVNLTESDFYYNSARNDGGAVCARNSNISISNCSFIQNIALGIGGALLADNSTVIIKFALFRNKFPMLF